jgi:2-C-methyl-D-erythritol 2,4-cyclodiphosphate synthase
LYPDTDKQFENIDSRILLRDTVSRLKSMSYAIGNVDITVLAQAPKISKYHEQMRKNIAADLEIDEDRVNIKATTTEKLGFVGRKEGIAVEAVSLVYKV